MGEKKTSWFQEKYGFFFGKGGVEKAKTFAVRKRIGQDSN